MIFQPVLNPPTKDTRLLKSGLVFVCIFLLHFQHAMCKDMECRPGSNSIGYTSPKGDRHLLTGSDLIVNCTLKDPSEFNSSALFWKIHEFTGTGVIENVNASFITLMDNRTAELQLPNREFPSNYFRAECWSMRDNITKKVCDNVVKVGDPPPSNITINCTSHDFTIIFCHWDLPPETNSKISSKWEFQYLNKSDNLWHTCCTKSKKEHTPMTNCSCESNGFCDDWKQDLLLKGENKLEIGTTSYTMNQRRNVILSAPSSLRHVNVSNTTANITWEKKKNECFSRPIHNMEVEYNIVIKRNNQEQDNILTRFLESFYLMTNLTAYLEYEVEIRRRLVVDGYYNSFGPRSQTKFKTLPGVPGVSPENVVGSILEGEDDSDVRNVTVYWKAIPDELKGADKLEYVLYLSSNDKSVDVQKRSIKPYITLYNLPKNNTYVMQVKGVNEIGESKGDSKFTFDIKIDGDLKGLTIYDVILNDGAIPREYSVSWNVPSSHSEKLVHYWCLGQRSSDGTILCNSDGINSMKLVDSSNFKHSFTKPETEEEYFFGLAFREPLKMGNILWSSCTIPISKFPQPPQNLASSDKGSTWIHLSWSPLSCNERAVGMLGFELLVGNVHVIERNFSFEGTNVTSFNVTGLSPGTDYKFAIRTKTNLHGFSGKSALLSVSTNREDSGSTNIVVIVVPIVCFIVMVLTAFSVCRYKSFREKVRKMVDIHLPLGFKEGTSIPPMHASLKPLLNPPTPLPVNLSASSPAPVLTQPSLEAEIEEHGLATNDTNQLITDQFKIDHPNNEDTVIARTTPGYVKAANSALLVTGVLHSPDEAPTCRTPARPGYVVATNLEENEVPMEEKQQIKKVFLDHVGKQQSEPLSGQHSAQQLPTGSTENQTLNDDEKNLLSTIHTASGIDRKKSYTTVTFLNNLHSPKFPRSLDSGHSKGYTNATSLVNHADPSPKLLYRQRLDSDCSTGYRSAATAMDQSSQSFSKLESQQIDFGCNEGCDKQSSILNPANKSSKLTDRQRLDSSCSGTGYRNAATAMDQSSKSDSLLKRQRLDSGFNEGYTEQATILNRTEKSPNLETKKLFDPDYNTGYKNASSAMDHSSKSTCLIGRERLDSGYCDGYSKTASISNRAAKSPCQAGGKPMDSGRSKGYRNASTAMHDSNKSSRIVTKRGEDTNFSVGDTQESSFISNVADKYLIAEKQRLKSSYSTGYKTASEAVHKANKSPSLVERRQESGYNVGCTKASTVLHDPDNSSSPAEEQGLDFIRSTCYKKASTAMEQSNTSPSQINRKSCSVGYVKTSSDLTLDQCSSSLPDSSFSRTNKNASACVVQPNKSSNAAEKQRRDSSCSVENAKASPNLSLAGKSPSIGGRRLDSCSSIGYKKAPASMVRPNKSHNSVGKQRLDSSCNVRHTTASHNLRLDDKSPSVGGRQLDSGSNAGYKNPLTTMVQSSKSLSKVAGQPLQSGYTKALPHFNLPDKSPSLGERHRGYGTGYRNASIAPVQSSKQPSTVTRQRQDSGFSLGYKKTSSDFSLTGKSSSAGDGQRLHSDSSTGYKKVSTAIVQSSESPNVVARRRLDSGCSAGYTKAASDFSLTDKSSSAGHGKRVDSNCRTGYKNVSTAVVQSSKSPNIVARRRLDSGCSAGYTKAAFDLNADEKS